VIEAQLAFKVRDTLKNWVFLNGSMYLVAYGYQLDFGSSTEQSMIVKVNIVPTSNTAGVVTVVNMTRMFGFIDQIASLELMGFVYTVSNSSGIYIGKVDIQTFSSMAGFVSPTSADKWKLY
jgi:transcriptional regulatory protein LevR